MKLDHLGYVTVQNPYESRDKNNGRRKTRQNQTTASQEKNNMENQDIHSQGTPTRAGGETRAAQAKQKASGALSFVNEHATAYLVHGFFAGCGLACAGWVAKKAGILK